MKLTAVVVAAVVALAGCGGSDFPTEDDRPPDLVVSSGERELTLTPYSYCWSRRSGLESLHVCADGVPQEPLPSLSLDAGETFNAQFPLPWTLQAEYLPDGEYCADKLRVEIDTIGDPIDLPTAAGSYRVEIFGRGDAGDGAWAFELTTAFGEPNQLQGCLRETPG